MKYAIWRQILVLAVVLCSIPSYLEAQSQPQSRPWSIDITPQVGYRTSMTFDTEPPVDGVNSRIILDANPSFGVAFGVRFADVNVAEFRWAREDTEMRVTGAVVLPRQRVLLDQFHFDFSREYVVREWPAWARPFIIGSVGWTGISHTEATNSFTRFSFGVGGGINAFPSQHLGFKASGAVVAPVGHARGQCLLQGRLRRSPYRPAVSQGEITVGPVIRF